MERKHFKVVLRENKDIFKEIIPNQTQMSTMYVRIAQQSIWLRVGRHSVEKS